MRDGDGLKRLAVAKAALRCRDKVGRQGHLTSTKLSHQSAKAAMPRLVAVSGKMIDTSPEPWNASRPTLVTAFGTSIVHTARQSSKQFKIRWRRGQIGGQCHVYQTQRLLNALTPRLVTASGKITAVSPVPANAARAHARDAFRNSDGPERRTAVLEELVRDGGQISRQPDLGQVDAPLKCTDAEACHGVGDVDGAQQVARPEHLVGDVGPASPVSARPKLCKLNF